MKFINLILFVLVGGAQISVHADESAYVVGVLAKEVKLYSQPSASSEVKGAWVANSDFSENPKKVVEIKDSFIKVDNNGDLAWVMLRYVRANRQIRLAENCGSMPNDVLPRAASTRGVGEKCVQK